MKLDLGLYLVTDSTPAILGDRDIVEVVASALEGGVSLIQYRDKTAETRDLIQTAKRLHEVTKRHNVPLLINDRVDVALAIGCEGVHLGQEDMDIVVARKLLGENAIVGVTASSVDEAREAVMAGADYLGIGTVFATPTKENAKHIIGTAGVRDIISAIASMKQETQTVCIGGINASNCQRVMFQTSTPSKSLDGVAVVSGIMAAKDPKAAAENLLGLLKEYPAFARHEAAFEKPRSEKDVLAMVPDILRAVAKMNPLCHNMTNLVVQNFAANVALCIGASPIMSNNGAEAPDLAKHGGALVINMGTVTPEGLKNHLMALKAYNENGNPVLFDPVGGGATASRRDAIKQLMAGGYFDIIKARAGNVVEISTVGGETTQQKGVDSGASTLSHEAKGMLVKKVAAKERNVVLMTGEIDYISDGQRTCSIHNGHRYLGNITGTGCTVGTTVAAFVAAHKSDKLLAALAGLLVYEIAAERAATREEVRGPGTFVPVFLDELYRIREETVKGDDIWMTSAKVKILDV